MDGGYIAATHHTFLVLGAVSTIVTAHLILTLGITNYHAHFKVQFDVSHSMHMHFKTIWIRLDLQYVLKDLIQTAVIILQVLCLEIFSTAVSLAFL